MAIVLLTLCFFTRVRCAMTWRLRSKESSACRGRRHSKPSLRRRGVLVLLFSHQNKHNIALM